MQFGCYLVTTQEDYGRFVFGFFFFFVVVVGVVCLFFPRGIVQFFTKKTGVKDCNSGP